MNLGELVVGIRVQTESLEKGLNETKRRLNETDKAMKEQARAAAQIEKEKQKAAQEAAKAARQQEQEEKKAAQEAAKAAKQRAQEERKAAREAAKAVKQREQAVKKAAQEEAKAVREAEQAQNELKDAYTATAVVATGVFATVTAAIFSGIKAYNEYSSVMKGFENQIKATGQSLTEAREAMTELSSDGLVSESDTAAAIKNLVNYGFTVEKAKKTVAALKDTAVDNRQAHYNLSEAVRVATEGIRMENSELSDAAGVQKNIAKMVEDYAKSIGKKTDALTKAEKAEAIYKGIMEESAANTGRAAEYAAELGGQQSQLAASTQKLAQGFGASMAPALSLVLSFFQPMLDATVKLTQEYPGLTAALTSLVLAGTGAIAVIGGITAAKLAWANATKALGVSLSSLLLNPIVLGIAAATAAIAYFVTEKQKAKEETEKWKKAEEELQATLSNGIQQDKVAMYEEQAEAMKKLKQEGEQLRAEYEKQSAEATRIQEQYRGVSEHAVKQRTGLAELEKQIEENNKGLKDLGTSYEEVESDLKSLNNEIRRAKLLSTEQVNQQAKQIAMQNREAMEIENLLKQYKSAEKGSSEWNQAQSELAKMFPQFSTAVGLNADAIEGLLIVKQQEVQASWAALQVKAQEVVAEKKRELAVREAAIAAMDAGAKWIFGMDNAGAATARARQEVEKLKAEITSLSALTESDPTKVAGVEPVVPYTPTKTSGSGSSKAYENKGLDEAYKQLEHKKKLNQLSLEDELKLLESIKAKHVKTSDERMEMEERLYEVRIALGDNSLDVALKRYEREKQLGKLSENDEIVRLQRIKKLYADSAEEREQLDEKIFEATQRKIESEKQLRKEVVDYTSQQLQAAYEDRIARENLSAEESFQLQDKLLNDQIWLNKNYLNKVLEDNRYTSAEKQEIEREITEVIRQQVNERLQLQKSYVEEVRQQQIDEINALSEGVQSALREKYQSEKEEEEAALQNSLEATEEWKNGQFESIKTVYEEKVKQAEAAANAEIEQLDRTLNAQIEAIQAELDALEQKEKMKSRAELDAEDQKKIDRLQGLIEYEHDDFNKIELQKELNQILADQEKRHQEEQLADKKEALKSEQQQLKEKLKEETDIIKEQLEGKKELMKNEYEAQQANINAIYEATKTSLDQQLIDVQNHYNQLLSAKSLQAEAEKMIVSQQQTEILQLLETYGEGYNVAGQSLGEQLYEGFKGQVMQIESLIDSIQAKIAAARAAAVSAMSSVPSSVSGTAAGIMSGTNQSISISNVFNVPTAGPSAIARAERKTAQKLAGF